MDFGVISKDIARHLQRVTDEVLNLNISPEKKQAQLTRLFGAVGSHFAAKTFADVSEALDATAIRAQIDINVNSQIEELAQKIVRDSAFEKNDEAIIKEFLDVILARSEEAAFQNANSLEKHPTLIRRMVGETCAWCQARTGIWQNPESDLFARHDHCDCIIVVSGFNTRNGMVRNYRKER